MIRLKNLLQKGLLTEGIKWREGYRGPIDLGIIGKTAKLYHESTQSDEPDVVRIVKYNSDPAEITIHPNYEPADSEDIMTRAPKSVIIIAVGFEIISKKGVAQPLDSKGQPPRGSFYWDSRYPKQFEDRTLDPEIPYGNDARTKYNVSLANLIYQKADAWLAANPETPPPPPPKTQSIPNKTDFR
jgi:hypothetical protein